MPACPTVGYSRKLCQIKELVWDVQSIKVKRLTNHSIEIESEVHGGIIIVGLKIHGGENSTVGKLLKWHLAGAPKQSVNILLPPFFHGSTEKTG